MVKPTDRFVADPQEMELVGVTKAELAEARKKLDQEEKEENERA